MLLREPKGKGGAFDLPRTKKGYSVCVNVVYYMGDRIFSRCGGGLWRDAGCIKNLDENTDSLRQLVPSPNCVAQGARQYGASQEIAFVLPPWPFRQDTANRWESWGDHSNFWT